MTEQASAEAMEIAQALWTVCVSSESGYDNGSARIALALDRFRAGGVREERERCRRIADTAAALYDDRQGGFESGAHCVAQRIASDIHG